MLVSVSRWISPISSLPDRRRPPLGRTVANPTRATDVPESLKTLASTLADYFSRGWLPVPAGWTP